MWGGERRGTRGPMAELACRDDHAEHDGQKERELGGGEQATTPVSRRFCTWAERGGLGRSTVRFTLYR